MTVESIRIRGASLHNLRAVDLDIPANTLAFLTGPSGSGKTSLAIDTLGAEGQRRYLETFSSYARQFLGGPGHSHARAIDGLPPAVMVTQRGHSPSSRSTVGTLTQLHDLLRLLFARFGEAPPTAVAPLTRSLFSFHHPSGACPLCLGVGVEDRLDPDRLVADASRTIRQGALTVSLPNGYLMYSQVTLDVLDQVCRAHGFDVDTPWQQLSEEQRRVVLNGSDRIRVPYGKHPLESRLRWKGIAAKPRQEGTYQGILPVMEEILRRSRNPRILRFVRTLPCSACNGARLRPEALAVTLDGANIAHLSSLPMTELRAWFERLETDGPRGAAMDPIRRSALQLLGVLIDLGVGYLPLDRDTGALSSGEGRRLRLANLGGLGLRGVLYVLDEPSAGLHAADQDALCALLGRLRDQGNSIVVVEHDPRMIAAADWIADIGPSAGPAGGEVLFAGAPSAFVAEARADDTHVRSATRAFLRGDRKIEVPDRRRTGNGELVLSGARRNNLRSVDATFLIGALNVVCGVSGAGKTSLVEELVDRISRRVVLPGSHRIDKVVALDSSPIGRTPRSNPATYTGISDRIRDLFASLPEAKARGLGPSAFSFNVAGGRCPDCEGAGVKQLGLRFLGTVDLPCESCGGKRFLDAVLGVRFDGRSIRDVLDTPIHEARALFAAQPRILGTLALLDDLGLGYLPLGHPATALSGGEAQRIKLATELVGSKKARTLYVLDEPTTGMHPVDVERFLRAVHRLVDDGHTVIAVEHDLDFVRAADQVIELGPGSGSEGGTIVVAGTPEDLAACAQSATGRFLRAAPGTPSPVPRQLPAVAASAVRLRGVRTRNLRSIDVEFPSGALTVVTGVSGSGKTSLAFDTLFAEGRDRFLEAWSAWARRYVPRKRDAVFDDAFGLTPTVGVRQSLPSKNPRSTVGTMTGFDDVLRLLLSRAGEPGPSLPASHFSPNSEHGACLSCKGLCAVPRCAPARLISRPDRPLFDGAMEGNEADKLFGDPHGKHAAIFRHVAQGFGFDAETAWVDLPAEAREIALRGTGERVWEVEWAWRRGTRTGTHSMRAPWPGIAILVEQEYERKHGDKRGDGLELLLEPERCAKCSGDGIREPARSVRFDGKTIGQWRAMSCAMLAERFRELLEVRPDLATLLHAGLERLTPIIDAALGYLTPSRSAPSLSSGEAQRVRLAAHVVSGLSGVTYVLDEPTRGLHPRDTQRVVGLVRGLLDGGNTVVVVEHELSFLEHADHVIDLGPGAGAEGGAVVVAGQPSQVEASEESLTGRHLRARRAARPLRTPRELRPGIEVRGARARNLSGIDVDFPAGGLIAVTGVSGSGKSTLVFEVVAASFRDGSNAVPCGCRSIRFVEPFSSVVRGEHLASPSSSARVASTAGVLDAIRRAFAATPFARGKGWKADHFSSGSRGGRCEVCEGTGVVRVGLDFLPDAAVECDACDGTGFNAETLACTWNGLSIAQVMERSVRDAIDLIEWPEAVRRLRRLEQVGLGYLQLGQPLSSLSGGERQRLGLAMTTGRGEAGRRLVLLDEPSAGLHPEDVARLVPLLHELVDAGDTLIVVEHDLGVISAADWIVDLGPEGGERGGRLVAEGSPGAISQRADLATGGALARFLGRS